MHDLEKVIKELESLRDICNAKSNMATGKGKVAWAGYANTADDAIALLKEQDAKPVKVFKDFEAFVERFTKCRANDGTSYSKLLSDVLELLKSQQAEIERLQPKTVNPVKPLDVDDDYTYLCDSCKGELFCGDVLRDHFCPSCGGRIEWKDGENDG